MKVSDLPPSAKQKLDIWHTKRQADDVRKRCWSEVENSRKFRRNVGDSIHLMGDSKMSLLELAMEYQVDPNSAVRCNTMKLQDSTANNMVKVSRTAGHFGLFSPCGIACALDIFWLDESLSQALVFLVKLIDKFPNKFKPLEDVFIGYDCACMQKRFCDNQVRKYPESPILRLISKLRKVHDRLHVKNHSKECQDGELNPNKYDSLKGVNTECAEQYFAHLLKFAILFKNTSSTRALVWLLIIQHGWNVRKGARINNSSPSKKMVSELSYLRCVKAFKTGERSLSEETKKQFFSMETEVRAKLLEKWFLKRSVFSSKNDML